MKEQKNVYSVTYFLNLRSVVLHLNTYYKEQSMSDTTARKANCVIATSDIARCHILYSYVIKCLQIK